MSATQTGELFMPGALMTGCLMFPVGLLLQKISPKLLVLFGVIMGEISVFYMTQLTPAAGANDILVPLMIRGAAMAFLFIPINQMVLGSFRGEELGQVAGMQNFFRQMGGSIGIASLNTFLTRFNAQNYNDLLSNANALNSTGYKDYFQASFMPLSKLSSTIGLWSPQSVAVKTLAIRVQHQVFVLSFSQLCWVIAGIVLLALIPLYLIQPKKSVPGQTISAH
jgi:DHA2 family multidrug resistance protein